ncbi:ParA family protein [Carnobacterium maltaromaticum]|uniref:ParA family protein n=1 Tax=Carnobacterium maltaromaticum TaxID=2751 RepID=UPI0039AF28AF
MTYNAQIIAFINMKGGVGKTTLCKEMSINISENYADSENDRDLKILLIDIDPQSNLTQSLNEKYFPESLPTASIQNIFTQTSVGTNESNIIMKLTDKIDLIPGELETIFLERSTGNDTGQKLMNYIEDNQLRERYDYIFIDCPPTFSIYTEATLFCSDYYFVPVLPDAYSALGVDLLERVVDRIENSYRHSIFKHKPRPENLGVIITRLDLRNKPRQADHINALKQSDIVINKDIHIFNGTFNESNKLSTFDFNTSIADRDDTTLQNNMNLICNEFLGRIHEL